MAIETNRVAYEGETASRGSPLREPEHHGTYETEQAEHKIAAGGIGLAALLGLVSVVLADPWVGECCAILYGWHQRVRVRGRLVVGGGIQHGMVYLAARTLLL